MSATATLTLDQVANDLDGVTSTLSTVASDVTTLEGLSSEFALVDETTTGTSYQTKYTYFYVPATSTDASTSTDDSGLGTFLRLGECSDHEVALTSANQATYYPAQHVADEGGNAATKAAGAATGDQGILLACDGRVLVKAGEKTYLNAVGDITIESDSGKVTITSGGSTAADAQNIYVTAGGGFGKMETTVYEKKETINGDEYTLVEKKSFKKYTAPKYEIYYTDSFKTVHGSTHSYHMGGKVTMFLGGAINLQLAVKFSLDLALYLAISVFTKIYLYGWKFEVGHMKIDIVGVKGEVKDGKYACVNNKVEANMVWAGVKSTAADIKNTGVKAGSVVAEAVSTYAEMRSAQASNVGAGASMGMFLFL